MVILVTAPTGHIQPPRNIPDKRGEIIATQRVTLMVYNKDNTDR